ncbi:MAG: hypothetical protein E6K90_05635 [Thaumarchaeota archaeon]|nr:MAG: hypothetical protein E6K90_05635 [Nitrososphaerota archaeon]
MNRKEMYEDVSSLLLLVPFFAPAIYALYLWAVGGFSYYLPEQVFLGVTRNPDLFLLGTLAIILSTVMEVSSEERARRSERVLLLSKRLQKLAAASLVLAIITAWYANGFSPDLSRTGADLFTGRYTIVFPALLVLFSFLIVTPINLRSLAQAKTVAIILLLAVPVVINEVGKRNTLLGLGGSLILTILAAVMLSWQSDKPSGLSPAR